MKITGLELINKIYSNEIKKGTHINYYRDDYLEYEFYGELVFTNGALWYTNNRPDADMEVKISVILDAHCKFEIIEEDKKIEKIPLPSFEEFKNMSAEERYLITAKEYDLLDELIEEIEKLKGKSE